MTPESSYIIKELSVLKMPGIPNGLDPLKDLAAQINIVTGPNGSGKSSTARAIQELIWKNDTRGIIIEGSVSLNNENWEIKIHSESVIQQCNGIPGIINGIPAKEGKHHYQLALQQLIQADEKDLAKEIQRQSIGGYDLEKVSQDLEFSSKITSTNSREYREYKEGKNRVKHAEATQKNLYDEEQRLGKLRHEKDSAITASKELAFFVKLSEYLKTQQDFNRLTEVLNGFPPAIKEISIEKSDRIKACSQKIKESGKEIATAREKIILENGALDKLKIPVAGIPDATLNEIELRLQRLGEIERELLSVEKEIAGLQSQEKQVLKKMDPDIHPESWVGLDLENISGLDKLLQDAHKYTGERDYLHSKIGLIDKEISANTTSETATSEKVAQGIQTLSEWLKTKSEAKGIDTTIMIVSALIASLSIALAYWIGWPGLLGIAAVLLLLLYALLNKNKKAPLLKVRETDFSNYGLRLPDLWDAENVTRRIDELEKQLAAQRWIQRLSENRTNFEDELSNVEKQIERLNNERRQWVEKLQAAPGFPELNSNDFTSLYWFITQVKQWQEVYVKRKSKEAEKNMLEETTVQILSSINSFFESAGFTKVLNADRGKTLFNEIRAQESSRKDSSISISQSEDKIEDLNKRIREYEAERSSVYQQLKIDEGDFSAVQELIARLPDYKIKSNEHLIAANTMDRAQYELEHDSLYKKYEHEIAQISREEAESRCTSFQEKAMKSDDIQQEITTIETKVEIAQSGNELQDALGKQEEALDNIKELYEKNLSSLTGNLIIDQLKKETQNKNRPEVFKKANQVLGTITRGRYQLLLDNTKGADFRAFDTVLKLGQNLDELSTGTRIQLILAVRLAFVETSESNVKLPLLADELLAVSDDKRSSAIIESLIEISSRGRQVFYFTAQSEEADKWKSYLKERKDISYKIFHLEKGFVSPLKSTWEINKPHLVHEVPTPADNDHNRYGVLLKVPSFDIENQEVTELHPWYVIEDNEILFSCLKAGITSCGQLQSYWQLQGRIGKMDEDTRENISGKIKLIQCFKSLYQVGRSKKIDRIVLENSGAIKKTFIDRVTQKLDDCNNDPLALLGALKQGEVSGFRQTAIDALEKYLAERGYISVEKKLVEEEIATQLQAALSNVRLSRKEAQVVIDRLFDKGF